MSATYRDDKEAAPLPADERKPLHDEDLAGPEVPLLSTRSSEDESHLPPIRTAARRRAPIVLSLALISAVVGTVLLAAPITNLANFSNGCWLPGSLGGSSACLSDSLSAQRPPANYVPVWRNELFGEQPWLKKSITLPAEILAKENKTEMNVVMRSAMVIPQDSDATHTAIRLFLLVWAFPLDFFEQIHLAKTRLFDAPEYPYEFRLLLYPDGRTAQPALAQMVLNGAGYIDFRIEASVFNATRDFTQDRVPARVEILWDGAELASYEFTLYQEWYPYSYTAVCSKPMWGSRTPLAQLEWREHHRLLGFEHAHWASRDREAGQEVERLNAVTGGHDSFSWFPRFEDRDESGYWDEQMAFNECYSTYRSTAEWIAVYDVDEHFAPVSGFPWTPEFVSEYFAGLDSSITSLNTPWQWVDRDRFGSAPSAELLEYAPDIAAQEMQEIDALLINGNKVMQDHAWYYMQKSVHRTSVVTSVQVHHGEPCCGTQPEPLVMGVYHCRHHQQHWEGFYVKFNVTSSIVQFYRDLASRLHQVRAEL